MLDEKEMEQSLGEIIFHIDWLSKVILCLKVKELHSFYVNIYGFCLVVS